MKSREFATAKARTDRWLRSVNDEYGNGSHVSSANRLLGKIQQLCEMTEGYGDALVVLGREIAQEGHTLADANRWLELLAVQSSGGLRSALSNRSAAIAIARGWTDGTLRRNDGVDSQITPLPAVLHLLRQEYNRPGARSALGGEGPVLIVVDTSQVVTDRQNTRRLRTSLLRHLRSELAEANPIAEGPNGNLLVLADRTADLATKVAAIDQRILDDPALEEQTIRIWIEPLGGDRIHLDSHLAGLVGSPLE